MAETHNKSRHQLSEGNKGRRWSLQDRCHMKAQVAKYLPFHLSFLRLCEKQNGENSQTIGNRGALPAFTCCYGNNQNDTAGEISVMAASQSDL